MISSVFIWSSFFSKFLIRGSWKQYWLHSYMMISLCPSYLKVNFAGYKILGSHLSFLVCNMEFLVSLRRRFSHCLSSPPLRCPPLPSLLSCFVVWSLVGERRDSYWEQKLKILTPTIFIDAPFDQHSVKMKYNNLYSEHLYLKYVFWK